MYNNVGGFSNGFVPLFIVVGFQNKVFYDDNAEAPVQQAVRDAIDSFPTEGVYVANPVADKTYPFSGGDVFDISNVFEDFEGDPLTLTVETNTDPSIATVSLVGTTLTITASGVNKGTTTITLKGEDVAHSESDTDVFDVIVFDPNDFLSKIEDFETGNFTKIPWTFGGNANWQISTTSPQEGTYCANSMDINDSQTSEMIVDQTFLAQGSVSFYLKVSSEAVYDYLRFYVDDIMLGSWTGDVAWTYATYDIGAGAHTFKWSYEKDSSVSGGTDNAFVDYIEFDLGYDPAPAVPAVPANVVTSIVGSNLQVDWDISANATSYDVYSSNDPYGTFTLATNVSTNQYTVAADQAKLFYYIVAKNATK